LYCHGNRPLGNHEVQHVSPSTIRRRPIGRPIVDIFENGGKTGLTPEGSSCVPGCRSGRSAGLGLWDVDLSNKYRVSQINYVPSVLLHFIPWT
jgi:hypothetical protein